MKEIRKSTKDLPFFQPGPLSFILGKVAFNPTPKRKSTEMSLASVARIAMFGTEGERRIAAASGEFLQTDSVLELGEGWWASAKAKHTSSNSEEGLLLTNFTLNKSSETVIISELVQNRPACRLGYSHAYYSPLPGSGLIGECRFIPYYIAHGEDFAYLENAQRALTLSTAILRHSRVGGSK
jgi:hypothetical protein